MRTLLTAVFTAIAAPAMSQVVPVEKIEGYDIARIASQGICFAVIETESQQDKTMVYSYYRTPEGQRWNVAGYALERHLPAGEVALRVEIDGVTTLDRSTTTQDGDFMLPFQNLQEITFHEELVESGEVMEIIINGGDSLQINLDGFRAAFEKLQSCLEDS